MGDLSSRRGRILGTDSEGRFQIIRADVPAMELYHYASVLRSLTGGRGVHSEQFRRYEEMPREIEQRVIDEAKKREQATAARRVELHLVAAQCLHSPRKRSLCSSIST